LETSLHRFLEDFVAGESRSALDPGCRAGGGACMACLHLGEPSCRWFNRFLDRPELFGAHGFVRTPPACGRRGAGRCVLYDATDPGQQPPTSPPTSPIP